MKTPGISLVILVLIASCSPVPSSAGGLPDSTPINGQTQNDGTQLSGANSVESPVSPINTPAFSEMTPPPAETNPFVRLAEEDLATRLNINLDQIHLLKISDIDWQDITKGCDPIPGQTLEKRKLSGYRIWLEANGRNYAYHVGLDGRIILCPD